MLNECFDNLGEALKKSLILVLLGRMIGHEILKMDFKLKNLFLKNIKNGFNSKNNDDVAVTLDIIGFLCQLKEVIFIVREYN